MFSGKIGLSGLAGPLGIGQMVGEVAESGYVAGGWTLALTNVLGFMVLISMNLGMVNLLPIPVLDGGHILLTVIEKVRGKPINPRRLETVFRWAVAVLLSLFVIITINDIQRGWGDQIGKKWNELVGKP